MITTNISYKVIKIQLSFNKDITLYLWDTLGSARYRHLVKLFLKDLDCVVIGFDITKKDSFEDAKGIFIILLKIIIYVI